MKKRILAAGLVGAGVVLLGPTPANAVPRPPAASDAQLTCSHWGTAGWNPVYSCYDRKYDNFWVYDGEKDGHSAVVAWVTATGAQSGTCRNAGGYGTWKRCDYNLYEYKPNGARNTVHWDEYRYDAEWDSMQLVNAPAGSSYT